MAVSFLKTALKEGKEAGFFQVFLDESRELQDVYNRAIEEMGNVSSGTDNELMDFARQIYQTL